MFCKECGKECGDKAVVCVHCGVSLNNSESNNINAGEKQWIVSLLLCFFLGAFGVHRFYTGHIGIGVIQLLTFGGCGIWTLIDFIIIASGNFKDANGDLISQ